jgi:hypothetical protein
VVFRQSEALVLHDISRDGRVLLANLEQRTKAMFRGASDTQERELSWLDWSLVSGLSRDGRFIVISESGEGAGAEQQIYLRETNGAPAVLLGPVGNNGTLSPDGQSVVTVTTDLHAILIYPVGPGQSKQIPIPGYVLNSSGLFPDGKRLWFTANEPGHGPRVYLTDFSGTKPRALTPEGIRASPTPDGRYFLDIQPDKVLLYPTEGGEPQKVAGINGGERVAGWSLDGQDVFVYTRHGIPAKVYRVNWKTGRRELMREIAPADRAAVDYVDSIQITPDGGAYAYSCEQNLSDLHLVEGLK